MEVLIPAARWQLEILGRLSVRLTGQTGLGRTRREQGLGGNRHTANSSGPTSVCHMQIYICEYK